MSNKKSDGDDTIATAIFLPILVIGFLNFIRPFIWIVFGVIVLRVVVYMLSLFSSESENGSGENKEIDRYAGDRAYHVRARGRRRENYRE